MKDTLVLLGLIVAALLIGSIVGYVKGFIDGRARERLEPVQHGRIHALDGRVHIGRRGLSPYQAIENLLDAASLGVDP